MKKRYSIFAVLFIALSIGFSHNTFAQRTVNVTPGFGTLNEAIDGDTTTTGDRTDPNTVYVLERNGIYLLNGTISNSGYHLTIKAVPGTGARPVLQPAVSGGGVSSRCFDPEGDITLIGLYVTNKDELGSNLDRTLRVREDSIRIYIDDCHLDFASQAAIRLDAKWTKIYIMNSIVSNIGSMQSADNGRGIDDRGNEIDTLVFENSTFYNLTSRILRDGGGIINYARINHSTHANIAQRGCTIGEAIETYFTNNLVINSGFLGREPAVDQRSILEISPLGSDIIAQGKKQVVVVDNNNFWIDPALVSAQPSNLEPVSTFDSTTAALVDSFQTNKKVLNEEIAFTASPEKPIDVITSYWDANVTTKIEMNDGGSSGTNMPFNFAYATSKQSYSFGTSSQPLGALTWFNIQVGVEENIGSSIPSNFELSQNYPNPFNPETLIKFAVPEAMQITLTVYNSIGQKIKTLVNDIKSAGSYSVSWNGSNDFGQKVSSGIYFYKLDAGQFVNVKKMILVK